MRRQRASSGARRPRSTVRSITMRSRSGSMAGLVTWAKLWRRWSATGRSRGTRPAVGVSSPMLQSGSCASRAMVLMSSRARSASRPASQRSDVVERRRRATLAAAAARRAILVERRRGSSWIGSARSAQRLGVGVVADGPPLHVHDQDLAWAQAATSIGRRRHRWGSRRPRRRRRPVRRAVTRHGGGRRPLRSSIAPTRATVAEARARPGRPRAPAAPRPAPQRLEFGYDVRRSPAHRGWPPGARRQVASRTPTSSWSVSSRESESEPSRESSGPGAGELGRRSAPPSFARAAADLLPIAAHGVDLAVVGDGRGTAAPAATSDACSWRSAGGRRRG